MASSKNMDKILACFQAKKACRGKKSGGGGYSGEMGGHVAIFTDGNTIYSYDHSHPIAHRDADGNIFVIAPNIRTAGQARGGRFRRYASPEAEARAERRRERLEEKYPAYRDVYYSKTTAKQIHDVAYALGAEYVPTGRRTEWGEEKEWRFGATVCVPSFKAMEAIVEGKRDHTLATHCSARDNIPSWYSGARYQKEILGRARRRRRCKGRYC
jgi:hypothetical protein